MNIEEELKNLFLDLVLDSHKSLWLKVGSFIEDFVFYEDTITINKILMKKVILKAILKNGQIFCSQPIYIRVSELLKANYKYLLRVFSRESKFFLLKILNYVINSNSSTSIKEYEDLKEIYNKALLELEK